MAKRKPLTVRIGTAGARQILGILKRHGNLRFDSSDAKDFALQEIANLEATDDDSPEAPTEKPPSAHTGQVKAAPSLTGAGPDDDGEGAGDNGDPDDNGE
jgi:hypothetical protein